VREIVFSWFLVLKAQDIKIQIPDRPTSLTITLILTNLRAA